VGPMPKGWRDRDVLKYRRPVEISAVHHSEWDSADSCPSLSNYPLTQLK